jgi:hypothetical protein
LEAPACRKSNWTLRNFPSAGNMGTKDEATEVEAWMEVENGKYGGAEKGKAGGDAGLEVEE